MIVRGIGQEGLYCFKIRVRRHRANWNLPKGTGEDWDCHTLVGDDLSAGHVVTMSEARKMKEDINKRNARHKGLFGFLHR